MNNRTWEHTIVLANRPEGGVGASQTRPTFVDIGQEYS